MIPAGAVGPDDTVFLLVQLVVAGIRLCMQEWHGDKGSAPRQLFDEIADRCVRAWGVAARLAAAAATLGDAEAPLMLEAAARGRYGVLEARWLCTQAVPPFTGPLQPQLRHAPALQEDVAQVLAVAHGLVGSGGEQLVALWNAGVPPWHVWSLYGKVSPAARQALW